MRIKATKEPMHRLLRRYVKGVPPRLDTEFEALGVGSYGLRWRAAGLEHLAVLGIWQGRPALYHHVYEPPAYKETGCERFDLSYGELERLGMLVPSPGEKAGRG